MKQPGASMAAGLRPLQPELHLGLARLWHLVRVRMGCQGQDPQAKPEPVPVPVPEPVPEPEPEPEPGSEPEPEPEPGQAISWAV